MCASIIYDNVYYVYTHIYVSRETYRIYSCKSTRLYTYICTSITHYTSIDQYTRIYAPVCTSIDQHTYNQYQLIHVSAPVGIRQYSECNRPVSPDRQTTIIRLSGITLRTVRQCVYTHRLFICPFVFPQTGLPAVKIFYHCKLHITI